MSLAAELPHLRVSVVSPGPVDTGFLSDVEHVDVMVFSQPMSTSAEIAAVAQPFSSLYTGIDLTGWKVGGKAIFKVEDDCLVGMGAVLAGTTHAPITAILMIFEQTNSYQIILPLMFVCIVSNFTARLVKRQSLHEEALRRMGVVLPRGPEGSIDSRIAGDPCEATLPPGRIS